VTQLTEDRPNWCKCHQDSAENQRHPELDAPKIVAASFSLSKLFLTNISQFGFKKQTAFRNAFRAIELQQLHRNSSITDMDTLLSSLDYVPQFPARY